MAKDVHPDLVPAFQKSRYRIADRLGYIFAGFFVLLGGFGIFIVRCLDRWEGWIFVGTGLLFAFVFPWLARLSRGEELQTFQLGAELLETVAPRPMMIDFKNSWEYDLCGWVATLSDVSAPEKPDPMKVLLEITPSKPPVGKSEVTVYFKPNSEKLLLIRINGKISLARQLY